MADPTPVPDTNPAAAGSSTSEFKLTIAAMIVGTLLDAAAGILHTLQDAGVSAPWFTIALACLGTITQIFALFGYNKGRVLTKAALIAADQAAAPSPK